MTAAAGLPLLVLLLVAGGSLLVNRAGYLSGAALGYLWAAGAGLSALVYADEHRLSLTLIELAVAVLLLANGYRRRRYMDVTITRLRRAQLVDRLRRRR